MLTGEKLLQLIEQSKKLPVLFSSSLDTETIELMQKESLLTRDFLNALGTTAAKELTPDTILLLKNFLALRWEFLKKGSLAYTRHPFLPINQMCLKIAEAIAGPEEAVCQLLMPTVQTLNRSTYSLKQETEDEGHFAVENYVVSEDFVRLIPVEEIFQQAKVNTDTVFPDYQESSQKLHYILSDRDFLTLQEVAGDDSQVYLNALRRHHAYRYSNKSLGFAIKTLAIALKKGSVSGLGSEEHAESRVVADAIKDFYDLWNKLPGKIRLAVGSTMLTDYGNAHTLQQYFLALFYGHPHCKLTPDELEQAKKDNIFNCIDIISNVLEEALIQHPEFYTIDIDGSHQSNLPELAPLLEKAVNALKTRLQNPSSNDEKLWETLFSFISALPKYESKFEILVQLALHAHTYRQVTRLLPLVRNLSANEIKYSENVNELIARIQPKFDTLKDDSTFKLIDFLAGLPGGSQATALEAAWSNLSPSMSNDKFVYVWDKLRPEGRHCLVDLQAKQLNQSVSTAEDCLKALKFSQSMLLIRGGQSLRLLREKSIEHLKPKFVTLFHTAKSIKELLGLLTSPHQKEILGSVLPNVLKHINSLDAFLNVLEELNNSPAMDVILTQVASQWIRDYENLLFSVKKIKENSRFHLCLTFSELVSTKEQLFTLLPLLPKDEQYPFLNKLDLKKFITSLDELKELIALLKKPSDRDIVIDLLAKELQCPKEELAKLKTSVDITTMKSLLEGYTAVRHSPISFFRRENSSRDRMMHEVKIYLEESSDKSPEELVSFLRKKMREIEDAYSGMGANRSHLYTRLKEMIEIAERSDTDAVDERQNLSFI